MEWAIAFWLGIGLMSIINVWKINQHQHAITYSWIMFCTAIVTITICVILIKIKNRPVR